MEKFELKKETASLYNFEIVFLVIKFPENIEKESLFEIARS